MAVLGRGAGTGLAEGMATGSVSHLFVARRGGRNKADRRAPAPALPRTTGAGFRYNSAPDAGGRRTSNPRGTSYGHDERRALPRVRLRGRRPLGEVPRR